jgi:hypothetical protein
VQTQFGVGPCPCPFTKLCQNLVNAFTGFNRHIRSYSTLDSPCIQSASAGCTHPQPVPTSVLDLSHISSTGPWLQV